MFTRTKPFGDSKSQGKRREGEGDEIGQIGHARSARGRNKKGRTAHDGGVRPLTIDYTTPTDGESRVVDTDCRES